MPPAAALFALAPAARAQAPANRSIEERLDTLMRVIDRQQRQIRSLERQVTEPEMAQRGRGLSGAANEAAASVAGAPATLPPLAQFGPSVPGLIGGGSQTATGVSTRPPVDEPAAGASAGAENGAIGTTQKATQPARTEAETAVVQREHAPLFERTLTLDRGISDTYYDRLELQLPGLLALDAIFLGNINLGQTKSHQLMTDLDVRYGLTNRLSVDVDVDVPYVYRHSNFGCLSYTYNVACSFADISSVVGRTQPAKVKLGDIVQWGAGVALAFSEKDSASISYTMAIEPQSETQAPGQSWQSVPGSETMASTLNFGLNHVVNRNLTSIGSVSIGLTPDAPNFVVGVRFPYTF